MPTVRMMSEEHGTEDFEYDSLEEAVAGFDRLKASCLEHYAQDGVDRTLLLLKRHRGLTEHLGEWTTDNYCPSTGAEHTPDWTSVFTEWDGDEEYLDLRCVDCGKRGCLGTRETMEAGISW